MFDYIRCEQPLPDGWQPDGSMQTKDLDCELAKYVITKGGRLLCDRGRIENGHCYLDYADAVRAYGVKWVPKMVDTDFDGVIRFGGLEVIGYEPDHQEYGRPVTYRSSGKPIVVGGKPIYKPHDYRAEFENGQLIEIVMGEN